LVLEAAADDSQLFQDMKIVPASSQPKTSKPSPQSFGFIQKSEARRHIEKQLESRLRVPLQVVDEPLENILEQIGENFGIPMLSISPDTEVSIELHSIKLRSALNLLFREPGLNRVTYVIQDEVLLITSEHRANEFLETVVYDVKAFSVNNEQIEKVILATVAQDSWQGQGMRKGAIQELERGVLVIAQTQAVHRKIEALGRSKHCSRSCNDSKNDKPASKRPASGGRQPPVEGRSVLALSAVGLVVLSVGLRPTARLWGGLL